MSVKKDLLKIAPILVLTVLVLLPFIPVIFLGRTFIDQGMVYSDLTSFHFALKDWYRRQITAGRMPFWTDFTGNGYPVFGEGEVGALYPLNLILYFVLPTLLAFNFSHFFHFWLAAAGTYLFSRRSLKLSPGASIVSAMTYAFCGYFWARLSYIHLIAVASYFPLVLFLVERLISRGKLKYAFGLSLVVAFQILIGYTEMFFYSSVLAVLYLFLRFIVGTASSEWPEKTRRFFFNFSKRSWALFLFVLAFGLAVLLCSVQILSLWETTKYSIRAGGLAFEAATSFIWPFFTLSLFVNPHALDNYQPNTEYHPDGLATFSLQSVYGYIGLLPLALALVSIVLFRKNRHAFCFWIMLVFSFLWAQGRFSQLFAILWAIVPGVKFFRFPIKFLFAVEFFLAILAAVGFDFLKEKLAKLKKFSPKGLLIVEILVIGLVYADLYHNNVSWQPTVSGKDWISPPAVVTFLRQKLDSVNFQIYSHGTGNFSYETTKDFKLQKDFQNLLPPNQNLLFNIPANREMFALFLKKQMDINNNLVFGFQGDSLASSPLIKQSLALQGVKYLVSDVPLADPDFVLVEKIPFSKKTGHEFYLKNGQTTKVPVESTLIYENKKVFPRINFVSVARLMEKKSEQEIFQSVMDSKFNPGREVILEEKVAFENQDSPPGTFKVEKYKEGETQIKLSAQKPGFLVISRIFYPGWRAFLDNKETKIYRANHAFQAILVPEGEHLLTVAFVPTYWRIGLLVSGLAVVILLSGLGYSWFKNK